MSVRSGDPADVVELPSRVVTFVAIREGLLQFWDDAAGEMIELPEDRLGVGELCLEPGRPFVVRLYAGRPVWVVGPADS